MRACDNNLFCQWLVVPSVDRAYKALSEQDYFLAKKIYYKQLKKKSCESAFGLASVYYKNNHPFYNLDSAYKYIQISKSNYGKLNPKKQNSLSKWKINSQSISTLEHLIDSLSFSTAFSKNTIPELQTFLQKIPTTKYTVQAQEQINLIAFSLASKENTVKSYTLFIEKYPNADNYYAAACLYSLLNKTDKSIEYLTIAFQKGFRAFRLMEAEEELDNVSKTKEFKKLITNWKSF